MSSLVISKISVLGQVEPKNWWVVLLRGIAALILGFLAFGNPRLALGLVAILLAIYAIIDGALSVIVATRNRPSSARWWVGLVRGLLFILIGMVILSALWVSITLVIGLTIFLLGLAFILAGVVDIYAAIRVRKVIENEWSIIASGIFAIILGILFATTPWLFGSVFVVILGGFLFIFGILQIISAFRLRKLALRTSDSAQEE
jgi:uncharacterized membrane protein HdeD (DUF308 family)